VNRFTFARLRYRSGDWDTDQRMPSNILNSLIEYTTLPVNLQEKVVDLESTDIFQYPFCYISGHKLVQFNTQEAPISINMYRTEALSLPMTVTMI